MTGFDLSVIYSENFHSENDYVEMDREEAEEKCLVQQQIIMDQMKQLKKV